MPRAKAILQSEFPYNISARCINKEWFNIPMHVVWEIFAEELYRTHKDHGLIIHSFVLMSNHFHLIASTPRANISQCMHQFMGRTSRRLTLEGNRINETYAGRHYKCILQHQNYFLNAYKYNYRNPVAAGICDKVEVYPFSTLNKILNKESLLFPVVDTLELLSKPEQNLKWLNTPPDSIKAEAFRSGLRHQQFRSKKSRTDNKPILTENDLL